MKNKNFSRREFVRLSGTGVVSNFGVGLRPPPFSYLADARPAVAPGKLTAGEVMQRIKENVHVPWVGPTVDTIKGGGSPDIIVTGITTSFMATLDVLQKSVEDPRVTCARAPQVRVFDTGLPTAGQSGNRSLHRRRRTGGFASVRDMAGSA